MVVFWVNSMIGFDIGITELFKFGFSFQFRALEHEFGRLTIVCYPTPDPRRYQAVSLPEPLVVHRVVRHFKGAGLVIGAAALGKQAVHSHARVVPTEGLIRRVKAAGYDSLWFRQDGIESILLLNSQRVVPIYGCLFTPPSLDTSDG
jgi:hypothetical protein